ncbi:PAS domain S-box protein [Streptomyces mirabilis]|uniref:PAS domain S-box protein n=1 Tax=Streptomyces mirabilis TaxID=68239 RepID=UPI0036D9145E
MKEFSQSHDEPFALHLAALAVLDDRGAVVGWSRRAQEQLGHADTAVIRRPAFEVLVDPRDLPAVREAAASSRRVGGWFGMLNVRHSDGRLVEMGLRAHALARHDRVREWILAGALAVDVLEWQRDRAVLDGLYRRCPVGLVVHGPDLSILRVNRAIERVTGVPAADFRGLPTGCF